MIKPYLEQNARRLDLRRFEYFFQGAPAEPLLQELAPYQNADGGFGNALEPDVRLPASSVLATTVAFQVMSEVEGADHASLAGGGVRFLLDCYDGSKQGWSLLPAESDEYPHAPWWNDGA